jgi:hypothetical protein
LCALLYQIFEQSDHLLKKYGVPEYQKGGHLASLFEPLWRLFVTVCRDPDAGEIICILDALDECALSHRRLLATRFADFCATNDTSVKFRVLITSRPGNALRAAFDRGSKSGATVSRLNGEKEQEAAVITKEINLLIDEQIERFKETRDQSMIYDDMHHILRQEVDKVENRTYLWVSLIFLEFQDNAACEQSELLHILNTLPNTVEEAYGGILSKSINVERARKLLAIVIAASRPLTMEELKVAFSIESNGNYGQLDSGKDIKDVTGDDGRFEFLGSKLGSQLRPLTAAFRESIRQLCGLFIRTTGFRVYLIHQTAREFLLQSQTLSVGEKPRWRHSFKSADCHFTLAQSCI